MKNHLNILDTIGKTPLLKIKNIYVKLETTNPSGSIKDRMAYHMIGMAEKRGLLKKGRQIIEVTSGNTGIALSMISAVRGYKFTAVMPESMSIERRKMMRAFGAKIILTKAKEDMAGAVKKYRQIIKKRKNAWLPRQFENTDNPAIYRKTFAKEIVAQTKGKIGAFVAATGTGGTLIGTAQFLKKFNPKIRIIAVEPAESAVISGKKPGFHKIQGVGEGFIPKLVKNNMHLIDEVVMIKSEDAIKMKEKLAKKYGILVGISSGANMLAALKISKKYRNVVTVFPDRGERYLSN